jgi:hypothetical protein
MTLPKGYRAQGYRKFKGGGCPVDPETFVDALVLTGETDENGHRQIGHTGVRRAQMVPWEDKDYPVLYYRTARAQEPHDHALIRKRWPHKPK